MTDSRLADKTAAAIATKILGNIWQSGQKLPPDSELCTEYGVSRTALREALRILTAKGLIIAKPKAGTCVTPLQEWSLWDSDILRWLGDCPTQAAFLPQAYAMRALIEPRIAASSAAHNTEEASKRNLQEALRTLQTNPTLEAESAFIDCLYAAADNPFAHRLRLVAHYTLTHNPDRPPPLADYTALVAAISQGLAEEAHIITAKILQI